MKKSARSWTTTSVALVGALLAGAVEARDLTVVAWGGGSQAAARKVYFVPFTEKTGIKLQEDSWSGGIGVLRTKVKGGNAGWDVVQVEVDDLNLGCDEGLFESLIGTASAARTSSSSRRCMNAVWAPSSGRMLSAMMAIG